MGRFYETGEGRQACFPGGLMHSKLNISPATLMPKLANTIKTLIACIYPTWIKGKLQCGDCLQESI
jgi:hypothetical protein